MDNEISSAAEDAAERLDGHSVACAESFTGGLLAQALASVGGSADWFRGGVVAYNTETKRRVLGVGSVPVISEPCAIAMATGVRELMDAEVAVSITGVGGPSTQEGNDPGTIIVGWAVRLSGSTASASSGAVRHFVPGEPGEVIKAGVLTALQRLAAAGSAGPAGPGAARSSSD